MSGRAPARAGSEDGAAARPPILGSLDPGTPSPFGTNSVVRAAVANPVTALLVQRALVMEVAHPAVAAAVEHHSRFRSRPLSRAWATADVALRLTFGDDRTARGAVRQIYRVHDHINGPLEPADQGEGADTSPGYTAHDGSLLTWVWATLADTVETAFTRWVRPFTRIEAEAFFTEMRNLGRFLGIPDTLLPTSRAALVRYVDAMLDDVALGSTAASRAMARQVLWFSHWTVPPPVVRLERVLALATLDERLSARLELQPTRADVELGRRLDGLLMAHYHRLPRIPVTSPHLYVLLRRPSIGLARRVRGLLPGG